MILIYRRDDKLFMIIDVLKYIQEKTQQNHTLMKEIKNGEDFERYIFKKVQQLQSTRKDLSIKHVEHNGPHSFPDLKITFSNNTTYGVEIKFSSSGNWKSKGNSVFETLSDKDADTYQDIYVLFGRLPKRKESLDHIEVRYSTYAKAIDKIEVTHSPRFSINLSDGERDLAGLEQLMGAYSEFRLKTVKEKNMILREYFTDYYKGQSVDKWYIPIKEEFPNVNEKDQQHEFGNVEPVLFKKLSKKEQEKLIAEAFIIYPQDLLKSKADYTRVAAYWVSKYFVYSPSLRDCFTSGGKVVILEKNKEYPKILKTFYDSQDLIFEILQSGQLDEMEKEILENWASVIPNIYNAGDLVDIYRIILKNIKPTMEVKVDGAIKKEIVNMEMFLKSNV